MPTAALPKKLMVIINPAAGIDRPILGLLNAAMTRAGIHWDVRITHKANDARRLARRAAKSGWDMVAAHGGDGTVMEVADGLRGTGVPMAIFPGGTGNAMSGELGIPIDLFAAVSLITSGLYDVRTIDMAQAGNQSFLLRVGIGFEANMTKIDQELKNRFGVLAYAFNAFSELRTLLPARYKITVDGKVEEVEGVSCMVANSGNVSTGGLKLSQKIDVADGLIDVVVFTHANLSTLVNITAALLTGADSTEQAQLFHRQGKEIIVKADPPQSISIDGEQIKPQTITAQVLPQSVKVVVPKKVI
ncbi:MAG: YegS/Rv2252/BmrU family lipid kinase [Anaerolineaceae bacterium]|nr:YegS/Rv2252/BmrU family lipid kinase [Anaerolineaceae bacterium]